VVAENKPTLLVVRGGHDPSFDPGEPERHRNDAPDAEVHVPDAGQFVPDTKEVLEEGHSAPVAQSDHGLEGVQSLQCTLETAGTRLDAVPGRGLSRGSSRKRQ
jgi:hypothetical protein